MGFEPKTSLYVKIVAARIISILTSSLLCKVSEAKPLKSKSFTDLRIRIHWGKDSNIHSCWPACCKSLLGRKSESRDWNMTKKLLVVTWDIFCMTSRLEWLDFLWNLIKAVKTWVYTQSQPRDKSWRASLEFFPGLRNWKLYLFRTVHHARSETRIKLFSISLTPVHHCNRVWR